MLLGPDWMMWSERAEDGKISTHKIRWCSRVELTICQIDENVSHRISNLKSTNDQKYWPIRSEDDSIFGS